VLKRGEKEETANERKYKKMVLVEVLEIDYF